MSCFDIPTPFSPIKLKDNAALKKDLVQNKFKKIVKDGYFDFRDLKNLSDKELKNLRIFILKTESIDKQKKSEILISITEFQRKREREKINEQELKNYKPHGLFERQMDVEAFEKALEETVRKQIERNQLQQTPKDREIIIPPSVDPGIKVPESI